MSSAKHSTSGLPNAMSPDKRLAADFQIAPSQSNSGKARRVLFTIAQVTKQGIPIAEVLKVFCPSYLLQPTPRLGRSCSHVNDDQPLNRRLRESCSVISYNTNLDCRMTERPELRWHCPFVASMTDLPRSPYDIMMGTTMSLAIDSRCALPISRSCLIIIRAPVYAKFGHSGQPLMQRGFS